MESILGLVGVIVGGVIGIVGSYATARSSRILNQRQLKAALIGELMNIRFHYAAASEEWPKYLNGNYSIIGMRMAKYGSLKFFEDNIDKLGFLSERQIASIMQLSFYIRNNDLQISFLLDEISRDIPRETGWVEDKRGSIVPRRLWQTKSLAERLLIMLGAQPGTKSAERWQIRENGREELYFRDKPAN